MGIFPSRPATGARAAAVEFALTIGTIASVSQMLPGLPDTDRPSVGRRFLSVLLMGAIVFAGVMLGAALEGSADLMGAGGLPETLFRGLLVSPLLVPVLGVFVSVPFVVAAWWTKRPVPGRTRFAVAIATALVPVLLGIWTRHPANRFAAHVMDPPPASVSQIEVGRATSFNDGSAWYFRFNCTAADFKALMVDRNMVEESIDWERVEILRREGAYSDDPRQFHAFGAEQHMAAWVAYRRPPPPFRVFVGRRVLAVTSQDLTQVQLMIDYWRHPATPR